MDFDLSRGKTMIDGVRTLKTAIGRTQYTEPLFTGVVSSASLRLALEPFKAISRAFAPMVRGLAFDVSELAIATFLQARAAGKPITLLPIVLAGRFQETALIGLKSSPMRSEADLKGKRIAVRAYSQTTGMWLRGILKEQHGIKAGDIGWVTFEEAHVAEYADPPFVERAPSGADMLSLLRAGEVDAVIVGNEGAEGEDLRPVFADPRAAGEAFFARHGFVPVNHLLTLRRDIAESEPEVVAELMRLFGALKAGDEPGARDPRPIGRAAIDPAIRLAIRYSLEQGLITRPLSLDEVWG
jgi:4,5-dihydroxyphthalate decarboxylase